MTVNTNTKQQIYQIIESLPVEQLPDLLQFLKTSLQSNKPAPTSETAPIYRIHQYAIDTGVRDFAAQHDHYLYGTTKDGA